MSGQTIKLTSKRQATFPAEICRDMGLHPGARLYLERRELDGAPAWILRPLSDAGTPSWFAALRPFASGRSHDMDAIRRSIGKKAGRAEP